MAKKEKSADIEVEIDRSDSFLGKTSGAFGDGKNYDNHYRTSSWLFVAFIVITEIVTGSTSTLPQSLAIVRIMPGITLTVFLCAFALLTSTALNNLSFEVNHPETSKPRDSLERPRPTTFSS